MQSRIIAALSGDHGRQFLPSPLARGAGNCAHATSDKLQTLDQGNAAAYN